MASRYRYSTEKTTPAAAAGLMVVIVVTVGGMLLFLDSNSPSLMPKGWVTGLLVALVVIGALVIIAALVSHRAEQAKYTKVGGPVLTWQAAEQMAANHMRAYGFSDARTTQRGADGGLDVVSRWGAAQVKFYSKPVGRPDVQRLRGAAHGQQRALFYAMSGFTAGATAFADQADVALFQFDQHGMVWPVNARAKAYRKPDQAPTHR